MTLEGWSEFNVAVAGAVAALAGLLIVALSVNVATIVKAPTLTARAGSAIATLVLGVVASTVGLIPSQPLWVIGVEIGVGVVAAWVIHVHAMKKIAADTQSWRLRAAKGIPGLLPLTAFSIGCILLMLGMPDGYYAVAAGCILAIVNGVLFSWIALVEVLR